MQPVVRVNNFFYVFAGFFASGGRPNGELECSVALAVRAHDDQVAIRMHKSLDRNLRPKLLNQKQHYKLFTEFHHTSQDPKNHKRGLYFFEHNAVENLEHQQGPEEGQV